MPDADGSSPLRRAGAALARHGWRSCAGLAALALAACAALLPDAAFPPERTPRATAVSVRDERGALDPARAEAALQRLDGEADGVLALHLRHVENELAEPLTLGNEARLLIDGPETQETMLQAIRGARRGIDLESYILEAEGVGERLAALLVEKRRAGLRVRVLYDSVGSLATPAEYFERLRQAGIDVCEFNPVNPLRLQQDERLSINNRDHRKLLIVDGRVAFTGGINISRVYSSSSFGPRRGAGRAAPRAAAGDAPGPQPAWRDTHVQVRGPVAVQFLDLFEGNWRGQNCPETAAPPPRPAPERAGAMAGRLVAADPAAGRNELYVALLSAIEHARQRVWLTYGYFVPDERVLQTLRDAARRGVDVRLMLPGFSDFWAPFHAGRSHYGELLGAGVRLFERRDALLHAKTAVIDGVWSAVGSTNLDWRSFVHNYEADLLILDRRFAEDMERLFRLDEGAAHSVLIEEWRRRGLKERLLEWIARGWAYLL
jgi:cardiolipin synthase